MSADLRSLLDQAAGDPGGAPDFDALARRGRARRGRQRAARAASGLAAVAVIAVIGGQLVTDSRQPSVLLDSPPKPGAGAWELVAEGPLEAAEGAEAVDLGDGTVLVVGGTITEPGRLDSTPQAAIYDVDARTWTPLLPVPFVLNPDGESNVGSVRAAATGDGRAVVWREWFGSGGPVFEAALLHPEAGRWLETGAAPLRPRQHPVVEWIDGSLIVWGGLHRDDPDTRPDPSSAAEALDAQSDRAEPIPGGAVWSPEDGWQTMSAAPLDPRFDQAAAVVDGRLVIWGGTDGGVHDDDRRLFADGALYDVAADRWSPLPDAGLAGRSIPAIVPDEGGFIVAGGQGHVAIKEMSEVPAEDCGDGGCAGRSYHPEVFADGARYDLGDGTWTPLPLPPAGVDEVSAHAGTLYGADNRAFYAYDSDRDVWTETPPGPDGWPGTGVAVGEGVVALTEAEMLDPVPVRLGGAVFASDVGWTSLAEADTSARSGAAVTAVGDEAVFLWGGASDTNPRGDARHQPTFHADGAIWRP